MGKSFPVNRIKSHHVYTPWSASQALRCHRQTVIRWVKHEGLPADTGSKPWMIAGIDLKVFLGCRQIKRRCKLALHYCYCFGCKGPREPDGKIADYTHLTPATGRLTALCPDCGCLMHKIVKRSDLEAIRAKIEVTVQKAHPRLVSRTDTSSNVILPQEHEPHGKAQQG